MSEAEARLLALLDNNNQNKADITALQEACVRVPFVSARLTGGRRLRLYTGLLLDNPQPNEEEEGGKEKEEKNTSTEEKEEKPTNTSTGEEEEEGEQNKLLHRLRESFHGIPGAPNDAELKEFINRFTSETGCSFSEEFTAIATTLARVIADAELPTSKENLQFLYKLLNALQKDFVVPNTSHVYDASLISIFRLLLQYHDPHLSLHFDRHLVNIGKFMLNWVRSLFVVNNNYKEAICMWDWILIVGDPTLTVYFAVAYLVAHRQHFLALKTEETITQALTSLTFVLPASKEETVDPGLHDGRPVSFVSLRSGKSLAQNADIAFRNTPRATQRIIDSMLFPGDCRINKEPEALAQYYASFTALPLERPDFAESFAVKETVEDDSPAIGYIVVDCRARESYDFARLPGSIFVGETVGFDSEKFDKVAAMLKDVRGAHLCIFGTGRPITEELNLLKVLSLHLAQCGFPYISIGGFRAIVPLIKAKTITIARTTTEDVVWEHLDRPVEALRNGLEALVSQIDREEARRKAAEIKNKAKDGVMAAKSWGLNVMQRVSERLSAGSAASAGNAARTNTNTTTTATSTAMKEEKEEGMGLTTSTGTRNKQFPRSVEMTSRQQPFSLGIDDDEEDDFGLISAPVYTGITTTQKDDKPVVKGTVINKTSPTITTAPATGVDSPSGVPQLTRDILTEMDEEFDKLFGDVESPSQQQTQGKEKQGKEPEISSHTDKKEEKETVSATVDTPNPTANDSTTAATSAEDKEKGVDSATVPM
ncbi:uncharacterized protein TM35_000074780 [Trypanosoma theileri]|uniref:TBC1 domain family member 23 n=1 Tax=Trypanosoma theileri TaxID=67003 RepID=A0A1X0P274_9TRYP|nr:uncharacterized protein TM35_000074780 [Trypanosoma theileri]ORC91054.1 hypothetical protein TM35_000074780 [Trypanosoma theileri]